MAAESLDDLDYPEAFSDDAALAWNQLEKVAPGGVPSGANDDACGYGYL